MFLAETEWEEDLEQSFVFVFPAQGHKGEAYMPNLKLWNHITRLLLCFQRCNLLQQWLKYGSHNSKSSAGEEK